MMVSVSEPHDALVLRPRVARTSVTVQAVRGGCAAPTTRTSRLARRPTRAARTWTIELDKGIPTGAGLGGGSADAAAVAASRSTAIRRIAACARRRRALLPARRVRARAAASATSLEPVALPPSLRSSSRRRRSVARPPRCIGRGTTLGGPRAARSNDLGAPRPSTWSRASPRSGARSRPPAGAPAMLAGSGSSYAVVFEDRRGRGRRGRVAAAVAGSVWLARRSSSGVQIRS